MLFNMSSDLKLIITIVSFILFFPLGIFLLFYFGYLKYTKRDFIIVGLMVVIIPIIMVASSLLSNLIQIGVSWLWYTSIN